MNIIIKRFLAFFMSFAIIFSTTSAFAASPVGWSASPADIIMDGAAATITALKGSGASALQSTIKHTPSVINVGKKLLRGGGAAALLIAIPQLLGEGVDWLLDPENNAIKYRRNPAAEFATGGANDQCIAAAMIAYGTTEGASFSRFNSDKTAMACYSKFGEFGWIPYNPPAIVPPEDYQYLPISTVAAKVMANAAAGDAASQELVKTVAIEDLESGELDALLNIAAVPKADAPAVPDPNAPPVDPTVPFDPSSIIAAIKSVMAAIVNMAGMIGAKFDALIANDNVNAKAQADVAAQEKIDRDAKAKADKEFTDWVKEEPTKTEEDTTVAIPDNDVLPADTDINFGGSCPANFEVNSSIFGNPINIVLLDTAKFCGFLSTFVKFPVYAVSSLFALYILGGRKDV